LPRDRQQLLQIPGVIPPGYDDGQRRIRHLGNCGKILESVVWQFRIEELVQRMAACNEDQFIAVWRGLGQRLGGNHATGTGTVFNDRLLAPGLR
jgi:hypothetical protein